MIYLDYAANTPIEKEVLDTYYQATMKYFANPNANHTLGSQAKEVIDQLRLYRGVQSKIISITNDSNSTIAKMSDLTIPYFIKKVILPNTKNISSQVPVVYIIERICRKLQTQKNLEILE